jgi:4-hydroxybenzoate polyprenyltransferase
LTDRELCIDFIERKNDKVQYTLGIINIAIYFSKKEGILLIWTIVGLLLLFWIIGFVFHIAGGLIHILLVVAAVVLIYKLVSGRMKNKA